MHSVNPMFYPNTIVFDKDDKTKLFGYSIKNNCEHNAIMLVQIFKKRNKVLEILKKMKENIKNIEFNFVEYTDIYNQLKLNNNEVCEVTDLITREFVPINCSVHKENKME